MVVTSLRHLKDPNFGKVPETENEAIQDLASPHIDSFNFFLEEGLCSIVGEIPKIEWKTDKGVKIGLTIVDIEISRPTISDTSGNASSVLMYPKECVERGFTYRGSMVATLNWLVNDQMQLPIQSRLGDIPIMVKSKKCNLYGMNPKKLVSHGELANETGGYFIVNGGFRILRLLIANRRNYPVSMTRDTWRMRDDHYTNKGVLVRCGRPNGESTLNILHYLVTGDAKLEIQLNRELLFMPLVLCLKVLRDVSDRFIYKALVKGREDDTYYKDKVKMMLRQLYNSLNLVTRDQCVQYIGMTFRLKLADVLPEWSTNEEVCHYIFKNLVLIHLETPLAKFNFLCVMARKLYSFVSQDCVAESLDVMSLQEAYVGGFTYLMLLKEKLTGILKAAKFTLMSLQKEQGAQFQINEGVMDKIFKRNHGVGDIFKSFIATGTLPTKTGCGLAQLTGLTVMMDHLNRMRDLSHFRAIHRGSYFLEMKTTGPRRLTGEAWGFICPVHTPDGAPCGLLNHLSFLCKLPCGGPYDKFTIPLALQQLGMVSIDIFEACTDDVKYYEIILDGGLVGYVTEGKTMDFVSKLRAMKVQGKIYKYTEIVPILRRKYGGQYPAVYIITSPCRMMRSVINLSFNAIEYIGTLEQNYLNVATSSDDVEEGVHSHVEIDKLSMFSNVGMLVPFSDCNPNPRNMYQCQMGKQTMGTPIHNFRNQTNNKLYRLQYPQVPLVRNKHYDTINMEEFCWGFNAVLAIVSYTGYDMEDAMVINKCSMERGLAHGFVYKSEFVDLSELSKGHQGKKFTHQVTHMFERKPNVANLSDFLNPSGLPWPGTKLKDDDPYYCIYDIFKKEYKIKKYKGQDCVVDKYTVMCPNAGPSNKPLQRVNITIRIRRNPTIGDKFASRSGQKGIMSRLYPAEDMPFSERGISPDIIFNPHGIPSRMTAGKLLELIAGKCAAEHGLSFDSSPFQFDDENPAHDYYGKILEKAGFNRYGEDVLYSGIDGRKMEVEVFEGIVYYQRLRHMVDDKWQVRPMGPIDEVTRQPIKGRKRGGAIRFGEMERDALIAHGAAFILKDRMMDCSDAAEAWVCSVCGDMLSTTFTTFGSTNQYTSKLPQCLLCKSKREKRIKEDPLGESSIKPEENSVVKIEIPYAFKYLAAELAGVNIRLKMTVKTPGDLALRKMPKIWPRETE